MYSLLIYAFNLFFHTSMFELLLLRVVIDKIGLITLEKKKKSTNVDVNASRASVQLRFSLRLS